MNFKEYQPLAARTSDLSRPHEVALLYAAASLAGEVAEWWRAKTIDEAGDVTWSIAELARIWGVVDDVQLIGMGPRLARDSIWRNVGLIAEASKKWACHGKARDEYVHAVKRSLSELLTCVAELHDLTEVYEHNIAKLRERYPDGFVEGGGNRAVEWPDCFEVDRNGASMKWSDITAVWGARDGWGAWDHHDNLIAEGPETGPEGERLACEALRWHLEERGEL